jgi:hypothetical protein
MGALNVDGLTNSRDESAHCPRKNRARRVTGPAERYAKTGDLALVAGSVFRGPMAHAVMTHVVIAAAHHRHGVERPLLFGAERRIEGLDGLGATPELGLVLGHAIGHPIEPLQRGHGAGGMVHVVMFVRRRRHGRLEGLERGFLIRAKVEDSLQRLGVSLLAVMHPGGALFGRVCGPLRRRRLVLGLDSVSN